MEFNGATRENLYRLEGKERREERRERKGEPSEKFVFPSPRVSLFSSEILFIKTKRRVETRRHIIYAAIILLSNGVNRRDWFNYFYRLQQ